MSTTKNNGRFFRKKRFWKTIGIIFLVLLAFRIALPYLVLNYVNKKLAGLHDYYGHVRDIDIALIRGAYIIRDLSLVKITEEQTKKQDDIPFFTSPAIDLSVEWRALFRGAIVGEVIVEDPVLNFVKGKHKDKDVKTDTADFRQLIKDLMPISVNRFEVKNGQVHYIDVGSNPRVDVMMRDLNITATNLKNVKDTKKLLPSRLEASGTAYGGKFTVNTNFDGLNKTPTFDLNAELTNVQLPQLNDFMRAYGNFDVKKGSMGFYTEFAAKNDSFGGYVKPIIKDLDVVQWKAEEGNVPQILWESLIGSAAEVLQNQSEEQLATKVPIKGKFESPNVNIWRAIVYVLKNAFVHALKPAIDHTINIHRLEDEKKRTILDKVFEKKKKPKRHAK